MTTSPSTDSTLRPKIIRPRFGYRQPGKSSRITNAYAFAGLVASLMLTLILWIAMWLLNGSFTVAFFTEQLGWQSGHSWLAHLCISVIEQHLWKAKHILGLLGLQPHWSTIRWGVYPLIICVGVFDVGTSTWGVQQYMERHSVSVPTGNGLIESIVWGLPLRGAWTSIAEGIAIAPEPLIVATTIILWKLFHAAHQQHKGPAYVGSST